MKAEPYPIFSNYSERDLLVFVYREYAVRFKILKKKIGKDREEWRRKVNKFIEVFNYMRGNIAKPLKPIRKREKSDIDSLLAFVKAEVRSREYFYPQWVTGGRLKAIEAKEELLGMKSVYNKLLKIKNKNQGEQTSLFS